MRKKERSLHIEDNFEIFPKTHKEEKEIEIRNRNRNKKR